MAGRDQESLYAGLIKGGALADPLTKVAEAKVKNQPFFDRYSKQLNVLIVALWVSSGVWAGMHFEGWHFSTAVYVAVQIMTTIGYGDVTFTSHQMHWFSCLFILFGLVFAASAVNDICQAFLDWNDEQIRKKLRRAEAKFSTASKGESEAQEIEGISKRYGHWNRLGVAFAIFLFFLVTWAAFFVWQEGCSCSYGKTAVAGCVAGEQCRATGGQTKSWGKAFYMAVVTMTTVGFGDITPESQGGRWFAVFWMLFGVLSAGSFVGAITTALSTEASFRRSRKNLSVELFKKLDTDGNGVLTKGEFLRYMLIKQDLVKEESLDAIDAAFQAMDANGDGSLNYKEIMSEFDS